MVMSTIMSKYITSSSLYIFLCWTFLLQQSELLLHITAIVVDSSKDIFSAYKYNCFKTNLISSVR